MQKIIKQELTGDKSTAEAMAQFTWAKDEVAWYYDHIVKCVFKVKFTGGRCVSGSKSNYQKKYQYAHLETSGPKELNDIMHEEENNSWGTEEEFYDNPMDAIKEARSMIEATRDEILQKCNDQLQGLMEYEKYVTAP